MGRIRVGLDFEHHDTFVPVIFGWSGIRSRKIYREIHSVAVAPTLSALIGTKPPSGSRGEVLEEVLENR